MSVVANVAVWYATVFNVVTNHIILDEIYKTLIWIGIYHCDYGVIGFVNDSWEEISDSVFAIRGIDIRFVKD